MPIDLQAANDFEDQRAERERAANDALLRTTVHTAAETPPDQYATRRKAAALLGYTPDMVGLDPQRYGADATLQKVAADTAPHPPLQRRYTDRDFARLAHDDSGPLSAVASAAAEVARYVVSADDNASLLREFKSFPYTVPRLLGAAQSLVFGTVGEGVSAAQRALGMPEGNAWQRAGAAGGALAKDYGKRAQAAGSQWDPDSVMAQIFGGGASSGVQSMLQNVAIGGAALATGGVAAIPAALIAMSATQGLESFQKAKEKGAGHWSALAYGAEDAVAEYVGERYLGIGGFLERVAAGSSAGKLLMYEATHETVSEAYTTLWQNFNEWANVNPDKSVKDWLLEQPAALAQTVVATLVGGGGQVAVTAATRRMVENAGSTRLQALAAEQGAQHLGKLLEVSKNAKLLDRSPEVFRDTLNDLATQPDGAPQVVRFDAEALAGALAQSGLDRTEFEAKFPEVAKQLPEALAMGGEVSIPVSDYVTGVIGTPLEQALQEHARVGDNEFSQAEAADIVKEAEKALAQDSERVLAQAENADELRASGERVRAQVLERLTAAGRNTADVNKAYATLWQHFFTVVAPRAGVTPEELFNRYNPRIQAVGPEGEALSQGQTLAAVREQWADAGIENYAYEKDGIINLSQIVVPKGERGAGKGTAAMQRLVAYADATGQRITLSPSTAFGATSKARLVKFYKRFGFVENKGRNKDFTVSESMIREPKAGALAQSAFHGGPHRFDKFSTEHIGTGEGAQAYGWGLYFAGRKEIAEFYRSALAGSELSFKSEEAKRAFTQAINTADAAADALRGSFEVNKDDTGAVAASMRKWASKSNKPEYKAAYEKLAQMVERGDITRKDAGQLYEAEIPDDAHMLLWDKPLSEQPEAVRKALKGTDYEIGPSEREIERLADQMIDNDAAEWADEQGGEEAGADPIDFSNNADRDAYIKRAREEAGGIDSSITGRELYRMLMKDAGYVAHAFDSEDYQRDASQMLLDLGIKGIKYLDNTSRTAGEGTHNYVVFSGDDVAIKQTFYQSAPAIWYSALGRAVDAAPMKSGDAKAWSQFFKGLESKGVKRDEIAWSGVEDWIKAQGGKVTKEQVAEFLKANGVQVQEVTLGGEADAHGGNPARVRENDDGQWEVTNEQTGMYVDVGVFDTEAEAQDAADQWWEGENRYGSAMPDESQTKFASYQLPGGTNYREVLLTLPGKSTDALDARIRELSNWPRDPKTAKNPADQAELDRLGREWEAIDSSQPAFKSSHWDEPNVLAHVRLNDRVDADGKRVLFVEEIQSDWGQRGKRTGFTDERAVREAKEKAAGIKVEFDAVNAEKEAAAREVQKYAKAALAQMGLESYQQIIAAGPKRTEWTAQYKALQQEPKYAEAIAKDRALGDRLGEIAQRLGEAERGHGQDNTVPAAPFVGKTDAWVSLAMKRIIKMAVDEGYDRVAFVNGDQSAERYDLSKQVDSIGWGAGAEWIKGETRGVNVAYARGGESNFTVSGEGKVVDGPTELFGKQLDEIVGKDIADKIMASKSGDLRGLDLKVGGEGMRAFYDKIVPSVAKDVLRKLGGGQMETVDLTPKNVAPSNAELVRTGQWIAPNAPQEGRTMAGAQPGFDITPAMREKAAQGMPLFQGGDQNRGGYSFRNGERLISLLQNADLTTFLHESGHFFLDVLSDLASMPDAPAGIVDDFNAVLKWVGMTAEEWRADTAEYQATGKIPDRLRKVHENWAEGFEQYLFTGKAPSVELRGVFHQFKRWMNRFYGSLKQFMDRPGSRKRISPEIRGVMDRLLATEEQITEAEHIAGFEAIYRSADEAGMTPEEWDAYQAKNAEAHNDAVDSMQARSLADLKWATKAYSKALKRLQAGAEDIRKAVQAEVAAEVADMPVERARAMIRELRVTSPEFKDALKDWKNRREAALERASAEVKAEYLSAPEARGLKGLELAQYQARNAKLIANEAERRTLLWERDNRRPMPDLPPLEMDMIAGATGFASGDELRTALLESPDARDLVEGMTEQRLLERYGDLVTPAGIAQAAAEAVHNEARARFVATELATAEKALAVTTDTGKTAKGGRRLTVNAAVQAAKNFAEELIGRRQIIEIKPAGHRQAETRAAREARRAMMKGDQAGVVARLRDELLQHYAAMFSSQALAEVDKGVAYLRKFDNEGTRKNLAGDYIDQIDKILERMDLRKATTAKAISERVALAKFIASQEEVGLETDIPEDLLESVQARSYKEMTLEEFRGMVDAVRQIERLGRLKQRLLTARDKREFREHADDFAEGIAANAKKDQQDTRTPNTISGKALIAIKEFRADHILAAGWARTADGGRDNGVVWNTLIRPANASGDFEVSMRGEHARKAADNLDPVIKRGGMQGKGRYFPHVKRSFNREAILAMAVNTGNDSNLRRLLDGEGWTIDKLQPMLDTLTADDWRSVQAIWDHFESLRPQVAAMYERMGMKQPEWLAPAPRTVQTADGQTVELRGGYYPVKFDPRASVRAGQHVAAEEGKMLTRAAYTASTTRNSYTKSRAKRVVGRPLLYSLDGYYNGLNEVIHDLAWHEWVIDASRLLRDTKAADAIRVHYGPEQLKSLTDWVTDIATDGYRMNTRSEAIWGFVRRNASFAGLAFNVLVAAIQPLGFAQTIPRIGVKWATRGVAAVLADPIAAHNDAVSKSTFMAHRSETRLRELDEVKNRVKGRSALAEGWYDAGYALTSWAQHLVDVPTWRGAYEKAISEGNGKDTAVALADQAVIDSQGGGSMKDLTAIERGGPAAKLFTVFMHFPLTVLNLLSTQTATRDSKAALAMDYVLLGLLPAVLVSQLRDALTPGDNDDEKGIIRRMLGELLGYFTGMIYGVRDVGGVIANQVQGNPYGTDYTGPVGTRLLSDTAKLTQQVGQWEWDDAMRKAIVNFAGSAFRLPSAQINRSWTGLEAYLEGETENPAAILTGYQGR